jgi:2,7-dihydroxy-5-methyl-1-naphthoate 7-O-methyltransferase
VTAADLDALSDLRTPWCLRAVVTLRIAEHVAAGASTPGELARAAGCDAGVLAAVMGHLADRGVFRRDGDGRFALNEAAEQLLDPCRRFDLDLSGIGGRMSGAWATVPEFLRTGRPAYDKAFGMPFWDDLAAHPDVGASFDALMGPAGHGSFDPELPLRRGWDGVRSVADVGGGTGAMLVEVLRSHPGIRGVLVDLPGTVERAQATFREAGLEDRVTLAGQSFFDPLPPGHDLYLVRKVLNDWADAEALQILRRCAEAAAPSGRVVVLGSVDEGPPSLQIEMVLVGGKGRTREEFEELAGLAGLRVSDFGRQASGRTAVECVPL